VARECVGSAHLGNERGTKMRAQRAWRASGSDHQSQIDQLDLRLAALNNRIEESENVGAASSMMESLKASAIIIAREIDELRYSIATEPLACILRKPTA
jgi:hypothetical protein